MPTSTPGEVSRRHRSRETLPTLFRLPARDPGVILAATAPSSSNPLPCRRLRARRGEARSSPTTQGICSSPSAKALAQAKADVLGHDAWWRAWWRVAVEGCGGGWRRHDGRCDGGAREMDGEIIGSCLRRRCSDLESTWCGSRATSAVGGSPLPWQSAGGGWRHNSAGDPFLLF